MLILGGKSMKSKYGEAIQKFGRSLLLPIGVMAPIGMVVGICSALTQSYMIDRMPFLSSEFLQIIFNSLKEIANMIFNNLPVLFACGVSYGLVKKDKGIGVFSSIVGYFTLIITMNVWLNVTGNLAPVETMAQDGQAMVLGIQTLNISVFGGIIAGLVASWATDKFYNLQLPTALAFFGGKKSVPIITLLFSMLCGLILPFFWSFFVQIMTSMSFILLDKVFGPFVYVLVNRLLVPFGLHHVWTSLVRFTEVGGTYVINGTSYVGVLPPMNELLFNIGSGGKEWELMPQLTRYVAQDQMIITMFMFPAIGFALYKTAFKENKKFVKGLMITLVMTAVLGNITEPLEFTFLFIAPPLYLLYSLLCALGAVGLSVLGTAVGYIRGTIFDFAIFGLLYENTRWYNLFIVGIPLGLITYFTFTWYIKKFNVMTPGREGEGPIDNKLIKEKKFNEVAGLVVQGLGGSSNILSVENCITRLRIDFKDRNLINKEVLQKSGTTGIFFPSKNHIHIVFGPQVEFVKNAVDEEMEK